MAGDPWPNKLWEERLATFPARCFSLRKAARGYFDDSGKPCAADVRRGTVSPSKGAALSVAAARRRINENGGAEPGERLMTDMGGWSTK